MGIEVVSRTEVTPPPDILKRVRAFLVAIVYAALIVNGVTLITQYGDKPGVNWGFQIGTLSALAVWWTIQLRLPRTRWYDLFVDFILLTTLTGTAPAPQATLGVYFPAILLRSMYEGRRIAIGRPIAYSCALVAGAAIAVEAFGAEGTMIDLLVGVAPVLMTGAIAGALAQLILSHRLALQQESDLLTLATEVAAEKVPAKIAIAVASAIDDLAARSYGDDAKAIVLLCEGGKIEIYDRNGVMCDAVPVVALDSASTHRQFAETIALTLASAIPLSGKDSGETCTIAPVGAHSSRRGAIALRTPKPPTRILRNGLGLAAENAGLAIEGADLNQSLRASEERRTALLSEVVTATEDQRATLAGDLHDGPIQSLTALVFELDFSDDLIESGEIEGGRRALKAMKQQLFSEINRLRQTMTKLLPPTLSERGIEKALRDYTRQQASAHDGVRFTFQSDISIRPPETAERLLYRVAQEALANATRHAHASQIDVKITGAHDGLLIEISDDGRGFDAENVADLVSRDRFGIASMQHIVEMIGGTLKISSSPATGTRVRMIVPIVPSEARPLPGEVPAAQ